jgi:hypothetical protein
LRRFVRDDASNIRHCEGRRPVAIQTALQFASAFRVAEPAPGLPRRFVPRNDEVGRVARRLAPVQKTSGRLRRHCEGRSPVAIQTALRMAPAFRETEPPPGLPRRAARAMTKLGRVACRLAPCGSEDRRRRTVGMRFRRLERHPLSPLSGHSLPHTLSSLPLSCKQARGENWGLAPHTKPGREEAKGRRGFHPCPLRGRGAADGQESAPPQIH